MCHDRHASLTSHKYVDVLQIYHELMVLERMHVKKEYASGASLQALTAPPLQLH